MKLLIHILWIAAVAAILAAIWLPGLWLQLGLTAIVLLLAAATVASAEQNGFKK